MVVRVFRRESLQGNDEEGAGVMIHARVLAKKALQNFTSLISSDIYFFFQTAEPMPDVPYCISMRNRRVGR
jgi:hypothetical protein